jgi:hypothetical protein
VQEICVLLDQITATRQLMIGQVTVLLARTGPGRTAIDGRTLG